MGMAQQPALTPDNRIWEIRGYRVMLDADLAVIYGISTKRLNQQVQRNLERFPEDFMFRLTEEEAKPWRSQNATSNVGRGGRRYLPFAFTEHGAVMLANVLKTPRAAVASIAIARAFVRLRGVLASHSDLARKLDQLEARVGNHDEQIQRIFEAIRQLMEPRASRARKIGFRRHP